MVKNALVIIDIQNYFVTDNMKSLPKKIAELIETRDFDFVLFSKFVNNPETNFYKMLDWKECGESPGIDIHPDVARFANQDNVFEKSTFSIFKSSITDFLKRNNIEKVYLCGIDFDACVISSAYEGFDLGYDIEVLLDHCLSSSGKEITLTMREIVRKNLTNNLKV